ncbi:amidase domain protein [Mycobacterium kansasii]|uniref:Amidase domain protein n=1 Tax=Mycobacterium kansasii TaxID=1768 RepID=A0A1V3XN66_MYCKA|nr:amidase domain protein [Mycobacterium kansasii]
MSEPGPAGEWPLAELAGVGLADDHRPGRLEPPDDLRIRGSGSDIPFGAVGGGHASNVDVVFDRDRDAQQGPVSPAARRRSAAAASASADSVKTTRNAFNVDWLAWISRRDLRTRSTEVTEPLAS